MKSFCFWFSIVLLSSCQDKTPYKIKVANIDFNKYSTNELIWRDSLSKWSFQTIKPQKYFLDNYSLSYILINGKSNKTYELVFNSNLVFVNVLQDSLYINERIGNKKGWVKIMENGAWSYANSNDVKKESIINVNNLEMGIYRLEPTSNDLRKVSSLSSFEKIKIPGDYFITDPGTNIIFVSSMFDLVNELESP